MDQCPLAPAEHEVLQAGKGEKEVVCFHGIHPIWRQVIPLGREASSTVTT